MRHKLLPICSGTFRCLTQNTASTLALVAQASRVGQEEILLPSHSFCNSKFNTCALGHLLVTRTSELEIIPTIQKYPATGNSKRNPNRGDFQ